MPHPLPMRPDRDDIAAPDLPPGIEWIGEAPASMPALTAGGPALVHFLDFAQLNSVRTLPYLVEWERRYREAGLGAIGVQAPRFPFGADRDAVAAGLARLGVEFPVAIDADRGLWHAYGCEGWPSLFLWKHGRRPAPGSTSARASTGRPRRRSRRSCASSTRCASCRSRWRRCAPPTRRARTVMAPSQEIFPGGSWEQPWTAGEDGDELEVPYEAGGAYATVEGEGEIAIDLDGDPAGAGRDRRPGSLRAHRAPPPRAPHDLRSAPPRPAHLVGQLRGGRAVLGSRSGELVRESSSGA